MWASRQVALLEAREAGPNRGGRIRKFSPSGKPAMRSRNQAPLTLRQPQLQAAEAALARDEARLAEARLTLSRTVITAPLRRVCARGVGRRRPDRGARTNGRNPVCGGCGGNPGSPTR